MNYLAKHLKLSNSAHKTRIQRPREMFWRSSPGTQGGWSSAACEESRLQALIICFSASTTQTKFEKNIGHVFAPRWVSTLNTRSNIGRQCMSSLEVFTH